MRPHLKSVCLTVAPLLLALTVPLFPTPYTAFPTLAQATQGRKTEADRLYELGVQQFHQGLFREAVQTLQQVLTRRRELQDRTGEAQALTQLSEVYYWLDQPQQALEVLQPALTIWQELKNRSGEGEALEHIGEAYLGLDDYTKAQDILQQALSVRREVANRAGEGKTLVRIGETAYKNGQAAKALEALQQAQAILQQEDRFEESLALGWMGWVLFNQGDKTHGMATLEAAVKLSRETGNRVAEFMALFFTAETNFQQKEYAKALDFYQQSLPIVQRSGNRSSELYVLKAIANMYKQLGQPENALKTYQQALAAVQELNTLPKDVKQLDDIKQLEGSVLTEIGDIYYYQKQYEKFLNFYQQALVVYRELKASTKDEAQLNSIKVKEAEILYWIGDGYYKQKQYENALGFYQQSLAVYHTFKETTKDAAQLDSIKTKEVNVLKDIASTYRQLKQTENALKVYQQMLVLAQSPENPAVVGEIHNLIGMTYYETEQYPQAVAAFQQALANYQKTNNHLADVAVAWSNLGYAYKDQKQYSKAIEAHQQAFALYKQLNNPQLQAYALNSIGSAYLSQSYDAREQKKDYLQAAKLSEQGLAAFQQSLEIARKIPDRHLEMDALHQSGQAYDYLGQASYDAGQYAQTIEFYAQSLQSLQQALAISKDIKDPQKTQSILRTISFLHLGFSTVYNQLEQYESALEHVRKMHEIAKETGDKQVEKESLSAEITVYKTLVNVYDKPEQYDKYLEISQKLIALAKQLNQTDTELQTLNDIAFVYRFRGQYAQALELHQQVLTHVRELHNPWTEIYALQGIGLIYEYQANYPQALAAYQQALQVSRTHHKRLGEILSISNIAGTYKQQGQFTQALSYTQQALEISQTFYEQYSQGVTLENIQSICLEFNNFRDFVDKSELYSDSVHEQCENSGKLPVGTQLNDFKRLIASFAGASRLSMATSLNNIGTVYDDRGDYPKALEFYQKALSISREQKDPGREANNLNNIANVYIAQGDYAKALELMQQALKIAVEQGNRSSEITYRGNLGVIASVRGNYTAALETYQQVLTLAQRLGQRSEQARMLSKIAGVYQNQGQYAQALTHYQQALKIRQEIGEPASIFETLSGIGGMQRQLGQFQLALETHQQALAIAQKIGSRTQEANAFFGIASDYREQGKADAALQNYQQALTIAREIGHRYLESWSLYGIGRLYVQQSQPEKGLAALQQALTIQRQIGTRPDEADTLSYLGQAQMQLDKYTEAQSTLQQSLTLTQEIGDRATEAQALSHLGQLYAKQNQPELAIVFYKQSVNTRETIRRGIRTLSREQQESYTQTIADTYRALADLLLSQGRVLEAQQVLELLKVQEIQEFNQTRSSNESSTELLSPLEKQVIQQYGSLIAFGEKVRQCNQSKCPQLDQMLAQLGELKKQYDHFTDQFDAEIRQKAHDDKALVDPTKLSEAQELVKASQEKTKKNTVLIYPLVLNNKLWLVWVSANDVYKSQPIDVSQGELSQAVLDFRKLMEECEHRLCSTEDTVKVKAVSQKLYNWLIRPIEPELTKNKVENLIFALDRIVRYIPMAALHDGKQYLIEKYTVSTVLSAGLTSPSARAPFTPQSTQVLGLGVSEKVSPEFSSLPYVPDELGAIVRGNNPNTKGIFPGLEMLNQAFDKTALRTQIAQQQYRIIHIATHGEFVRNNYLASFLLLGTGKQLTIEDIRVLPSLNNVDLIVLSACESALGGSEDSGANKSTLDGIEISSMSYHFLNRNAKTVIASLWKVNDPSTSLFMREFYQSLATDTPQNPMTKAEALRQAQLRMLSGKAQPTPGKTEGNRTVVQPNAPNQPTRTDQPSTADYAHPYYWAPFILIGNGL